jgi:hypothetical protein
MFRTHSIHRVGSSSRIRLEHVTGSSSLPTLARWTIYISKSVGVSEWGPQVMRHSRPFSSRSANRVFKSIRVTLACLCMSFIRRVKIAGRIILDSIDPTSIHTPRDHSTPPAHTHYEVCVTHIRGGSGVLHSDSSSLRDSFFLIVCVCVNARRVCVYVCIVSTSPRVRVCVCTL